MLLRYQRIGAILPAILLAVTLLVGSGAAYADPAPTASNCTNFSAALEKLKNSTENPPPSSTTNPRSKGILESIADTIKNKLGAATENLYKGFVEAPGYKNAVNAAMVLMVTIYGVAFTMGITQLSASTALVRLMKLGFIYAMIAPGGEGWEFFSRHVVQFFDAGTDQLIGAIIDIGTNTTPNLQTLPNPFAKLDLIAEFFIQPDMIIAMLGFTFNSGPYGLTMGALLGMAFGGVLKMLIDALKIYTLSWVMRALLLGVAPIFIVFLLFDKTKALFTGWLNALVNLSLRPILYFTFLSFFLVMITTAIPSLLSSQAPSQPAATNNSNQPTPNNNIELCWMEGSADTGGTVNKKSFWAIKLPGQLIPTIQENSWKGPISCLYRSTTTSSTSNTPTPANDQCKEFPIDILSMLSFLILVYIASMFGGVTDRLASEISNAFVNLDMQGKMTLRSGEETKAASPNTNAGNAPPSQTTVPRR